jgi:carbamoyl-phosphate synthase large subunit
MYKLLLLSGGSLVGQNILSSLSARRNSCHLTALNCVEDVPSIFDYDTTYLVPALVHQPGEFEQRFDEICAVENPDLIIPCRDEDIAFLARLSETRSELRSKLLCGSREVSMAFLDKNLSWEFSKLHGLPFAPVITTDQDRNLIRSFIRQHNLPVIAKPKNGFASLGVKLIYKMSQIEPLIGRPDYILQQYIGDPEKIFRYVQQESSEGIPLFHSFEELKISIQASVGPNCEMGGIFVTKNHMSQGKSENVVVCDDTDTYEQGSDWVEKIIEAGWRGPLNIQCQRDTNGKLIIFEYNGRFTGATSARHLLGFDEVGIILDLWLDQGFPPSMIRKGNFSVTRVPVSRVTDLSGVEQLRLNGVWHRTQ